MKKIPSPKVFMSLAAAAFAALLSAVWFYNPAASHLEKKTRFMMGAYVTIQALGPKDITASAIEKAMARLQEIDVKFNPINEKSPVYAFNNSLNPLDDAEVVSLVAAALRISEECGGAFDITVAPLSSLWGFYSKSYRVPSQAEIDDCLTRIGYKHLAIKDGKLVKDMEGVKIDLGGIAKGYALAEAAKVLRASGVTGALIDVGGDIYAMGKKAGVAWRVGLKNPRGDGIAGYVEVEDTAVISSGDYERFFIEGGKRRHHIFDPRSGYPADGVIAITIIYDDPITAQAMAKVPFVMGPEEGMKVLERIKGMDVFVTVPSGEVIHSKDLKHTLII